jgi:hypothetical protein
MTAASFSFMTNLQTGLPVMILDSARLGNVGFLGAQASCLPALAGIISVKAFPEAQQQSL